MEKIFKFKVQGQRILLESIGMVASDTVNIYKAQFEFTDDWEDFAPATAVFKNGKTGTVYEMLLSSSNICTIPAETITTAGSLYVGVYGTTDTPNQYPTIWSDAIPIIEGVCEGAVPSEPTPSIYAQIISALALKEDKTNKVSTLDSTSTNAQYPSAKCTYDKLATKVDEAPIDNKEYVRKNATWIETEAWRDSNAVYYTVDTDKTDAEKAQARTNIGAGTSSFSGDYDDLTNKPTKLSDFENDEGFINSSALLPYRTSSAQDVIDATKATTEQLTAHTSNTTIHVTSSDKTAWSAKYDKPDTGIPKTDLASGVQTSLEKADTALQTHQSLSAYRTSAAQDVIDATKVDKVTGKGLSTNDFSDAYKTKLDGIDSGAEVNVNADWNATSGDAQILNKPTIPTESTVSGWGFTKNTGTVTEITMNSTSMGTSGTVDLGNVITKISAGSGIVTTTTSGQSSIEIASEMLTTINGKETSSNKVTSLSSSSTDTQYPSAKCVYDMIGNVESTLAELIGG